MPSPEIPPRPTEPHQALTAVYQQLRRRRTEILASSGVTLQQYTVLRILHEEGDPGMMPTLTIAARLPEAVPGITRLVDRLERKGLIQRHRGGDRRRVYCRLTEAGTELVERLRREVQAFEGNAFDCLNANEINVLMHLMRRILGRSAKVD